MHIDYVEQIYFAGGEPLIMDEHYRILEELERRGMFDVRLVYNTNFTQVRLKDRYVFDFWKKFKNVSVGASLDAMGDPEIETRISSFEMAFRMQSSAPELMDLSKEPKHVLDMYGAEPGKPSFANNCLLARRLIERGVRFVQLFHEAWDHHGGLTNGLKAECGKTDKASAALVKDLKQRGLLKDTLVIWGGEFGRTPMVQGGNDGRDHHPNCYTMWLAGGGVKPGITLGRSDDFGFNGVEDRVHVHDLNATMLHLLGLNHEKLTYRLQGRDFRLTDVHGEVVDKLIA